MSAPSRAARRSASSPSRRVSVGARWSASSTRRVCSSQRWMFTQATKVFFARRERPVDGPVLVHALVDVLEEVQGQPVAQASLLVPIAGPCSARRRAAARPRGGRGRRGGPRRRAWCQGRGCRAGARARGRRWPGRGCPRPRAEAAESDAEGEAQVVGGGLGVVAARRTRGAARPRTIDGGLGPVLGVAPGGGAGAAELDGGFTVRFVDIEGARAAGDSSDAGRLSRKTGMRRASPVSKCRVGLSTDIMNALIGRSAAHSASSAGPEYGRPPTYKDARRSNARAEVVPMDVIATPGLEVHDSSLRTTLCRIPIR